MLDSVDHSSPFDPTDLTLHVPPQLGSSEMIDPINLDGDKRKATTRIASEWAALTSNVSVRDPDWVRGDPLRRGNTWATDESVKLNVSDSVFVFGALDAESTSVEQQQLRWAGKTGFGLKLRPWLLHEVQVRGGPAVRYDSPDRRSTTPNPERSELFLELTTKLPLPVVGAINLEYTGTAIPPLSAAERELIKQNVKFALPFSGSSQFHVGANWRSDETLGATPFIDRAQLYLGVQLKR